MATFKAILSAPKKDGTISIRIRVYHNNESQYVKTNLYVAKKDITSAGTIKDNYVLDSVEDKIRSLRKMCNMLGDKIDTLSCSDLVDILDGKRLDSNGSIDFITALQDDYEKLKKQGRAGTAATRIAVANALIRFEGKKHLDVNKMTARYIESFIEFLQDEPSQTTGKTKSSFAMYLSVVRKVINDLKKMHNDEELNIIRITANPFSKIRIPKDKIPLKRSLSIEQIQAIINLPYLDKNVNNGEFNRYNLAKDMFLLSFMLMGINSADLYACENYKNEIITYNRKKTSRRRSDSAEMQVKVEKCAQKIMGKYLSSDKSAKRVFRFFKTYANSQGFNAAINKGLNKDLKNIGEDIGVDNLQFYAARHSWATIAQNDVGLDKYLVHECLNHVDETMKITEIYLRKDFSRFWDANTKVLSLFDWSNL